MADLKPIDEATRDFIKAAAAWNSETQWDNYSEWVDGSRVLEFDSAIIEAKEGWFVLARFGLACAGCVRTGPVGGLAAAEAVVSDLRKSQAAAVGRAFGAFVELLDAFEYPDWPTIDMPAGLAPSIFDGVEAPELTPAQAASMSDVEG